jgi:hypothetical protein
MFHLLAIVLAIYVHWAEIPIVRFWEHRTISIQ